MKINGRKWWESWSNHFFDTMTPLPPPAPSEGVSSVKKIDEKFLLKIVFSGEKIGQITMAPMDWNWTGYPLHWRFDYLRSRGAKNRTGKRKEKKKIDASYHHSTLQFSPRQKSPQFVNTDHRGEKRKIAKPLIQGSFLLVGPVAYLQLLGGYQ